MGAVEEADRKLITEIGREATEYNRKLMIESDEKLLAEYRANQALTINEVDQDAFRAATAPVLDKWEQKPFGDFVKRLRAAAAA
jgi:TRAP-type transport system periplasmic protein